VAYFPGTPIEPIYAKTLAEFRQMTDQQLIEAHDAVLATGSFIIGPDEYLNELKRREDTRRTRTMVRLTVAITLLTLANVALVAYSIS
jgi:hypothetical protein